MAGLSNVKIYINSNENVGLTTATIYYSCDGELPETDENNAGTRQYRYNTPVYSWTIKGVSASGKTGSVSLTGLTQGAANTISATVKLTCDRDRYEWDDEKERWVYDSTSDYTVDTETTSLTVYTRPGVFTGFDGVKDQLINDVINSTSAANWNTHCGKYLSWKNQASKYGTVTIAFPSGQLITASWFNSLRTACGATAEQVPVAVRDQTLITADIFKKLGAAISKS